MQLKENEKSLNMMGCIKQNIEVLADFFPSSAKFLSRYLFLNQVQKKSMTGTPRVNHLLPWFGELTVLLGLKEKSRFRMLALIWIIMMVLVRV